ncbi:hypothetical protein D3C81_1573450 [compost metagenome]
MVDRQAGVAADDQLLDDAPDRLVEVDAVHFVARYQDVVDGDLVQRLQAVEQAVAGCFVLLVFVKVVGFLRVQGHGRRLHAERAQEQLGETVQQAGQRLQEG